MVGYFAMFYFLWNSVLFSLFFVHNYILLFEKIWFHDFMILLIDIVGGTVYLQDCRFSFRFTFRIVGLCMFLVWRKTPLYWSGKSVQVYAIIWTLNILLTWLGLKCCVHSHSKLDPLWLNMWWLGEWLQYVILPNIHRQTLELYILFTYTILLSDSIFEDRRNDVCMWLCNLKCA